MRAIARTPSVVLAVGGLLWLALIGAGIKLLFSYAAVPGSAANPPGSWPAGAKIHRSSAHPTLVLLAHPHCPCTRATIGELSKIMVRCQGRLTAQVLFLVPDGFSEEWAQTDLWHTAASIPGVTVRMDPLGEEARRFGASTSGQTLLYDAAGRLCFSGGITASRGHAGPNRGEQAILTSIEGRSPKDVQTPVFGCPLEAPSTAPCEAEVP